MIKGKVSSFSIHLLARNAMVVCGASKCMHGYFSDAATAPRAFQSAFRFITDRKGRSNRATPVEAIKKQRISVLNGVFVLQNGERTN